MRVHPISALLVLAIAVSLPACKKDAESKDGKAAAEASASTLAVSTTPVVERDMASGITVSGPVAAVEEMQLGVELSGLRVTGLNVDVGQSVRQGQVLLTLDHRTLDSDLAQARAALREAQTGADLARANLARGQNLAADKYISAMQLDELRAARTQGEARVATARAAFDAASLRRSFADLRAPANGVISKRLVQSGQVVAAGMELMRLIRDGRLEWRADLPASQLAAVKPGDTIRLTSREGVNVDGVVRAVSPGVDATTRTGTVYANLPAPQGLQPGTFLQGHIATGTTRAKVVPASSIVMRDGFPTVFVIENGNKARAIRVEQGQKTGDLVEITRGLETGKAVVTEGAGFLADGDTVRVVAPTTSAAAKPQTAGSQP
ncbi:efflux RND transporter periplasmic adaptor subunit [Lysobacter soyae]|uniref:Efflux RND transporter periplasmic adaptor subunit n=1 Tax=Lysobacter soyae TaxID=2764185 RepID=A0ABX8WQQ2_9GAMM|nr:efflux RND transporter periplasmic adaptor subunit [Lysobacter sp. CJ11]QYR53159.1 efflux RND transporter periplasmic adaptor subunit [Lysobacter sp. CJ11]